LGEKAHLRIAWSVAALRRGGRTRLVYFKYIFQMHVFEMKYCTAL